jgi:hypothetical protein
MRKFLTSILEKMLDGLKTKDISEEVLKEGERAQTPPPLLGLPEKEAPPTVSETIPIEEAHQTDKEHSSQLIQKEAEKKRKPKKKTGNSFAFHPESTEVVSMGFSRDVMPLMDIPFLALSKKRKEPIIYESADKKKKVVISRHSNHFLASIYDWDIILVVAGKLQEILNSGSDIPPRTITIPRHELLKALHRKEGVKQQKDLEKSLHRLRRTAIDTTVHNEDGRHKFDFGFIDSWGYMERKNDREKQVIFISLSEWLYELCCAKGSLLKTDPSYFTITSGLKKFLYRTAKRHAGNNRDGWEFSVERLYEKSGSENDFRFFKARLKKAVLENDIPSYSTKWIVKNKKEYVLFKNKKMLTIDESLDEFQERYGEIEELKLLSNA